MKRDVRNNIIAALVPIVFFLSIEGCLRIVGFDYYPIDTGLTLPSGYRMFLKKDGYYLPQWGPKFLVEKPENEYRIFILFFTAV